jgi:toxin ParE1/3/4
VNVRVLSPALREIAEAAEWFDARRIGLGGEFWSLVDDVLARIESNPLQFARSEFSTDEVELRYAIVERFHYVVHFMIERDEVQVVSIAHGARKPGYWRDRIL